MVAMVTEECFLRHTCGLYEWTVWTGMDHIIVGYAQFRPRLGRSLASRWPRDTQQFRARPLYWSDLSPRGNSLLKRRALCKKRQPEAWPGTLACLVQTLLAVAIEF